MLGGAWAVNKMRENRWGNRREIWSGGRVRSRKGLRSRRGRRWRGRSFPHSPAMKKMRRRIGCRSGAETCRRWRWTCWCEKKQKETKEKDTDAACVLRQCVSDSQMCVSATRICFGMVSHSQLCVPTTHICFGIVSNSQICVSTAQIYAPVTQTYAWQANIHI